MTSPIYRRGRLVRRASLAIAVASATTAMAFIVAAQAPGGAHDRPQVWFAPNDDLPRARFPGGFANRDFPHLFDPNPAWDAKIDVFKISPMMGSTVGPAAELGRINAFLKDRRIALAVDTGGATMDNAGPTPGECGYGVEGMIRPGRNAIAFRRLKQLGIEVAYVTLDEPLTYGHYYARKNACRYSIQEVARRTATEIAEVHQFYPNARIVDVEAPQITTAAQWNADFPTWLKAYRDAGGASFDAVVFDMDWGQTWRQTASSSLRALHAAGVRGGIILDGAGPGASDAEAVAAYKRNIEAVEGTGLKFDIVMVANRTPHPTRNLPQSDPQTLTSVLAWYLKQREAGGRGGSGR